MTAGELPFALPPQSAAEDRAHAVVRTLAAHGHEAYLVGGCVRDRLLERAVSDADVATGATPDEVQRLFPKTYAVGAAFGVVVVVDGDQQTEVATFRRDGGYVDGRHPQSVEFADAREDARRRDFTINALYYDPLRGVLIDFVGGIDDLRRGVVRAIGAAPERFAEDYLRMLRAVRFAARFDFELDPATFAAVCQHAPSISAISGERVFAELTKMLVGPRPERAFTMLDDCGLLSVVLPEIVAMKGVAQPPQFHPEGDVWVHTLLLLAHMIHPTPDLAWAVLLHDVGKPPTFAIGPHGRETFPCHASVGAEMAEDVLGRLRCSRQFIADVRQMVHYHMSFADVRAMRPARRRRMMARNTFEYELELHRIDCMACHGLLTNYVFMLDELQQLADEPPVPAPLLRGQDVLARGIAPGPAVGRLLRGAQDQQLNGVFSSRADALAWLDDQLAGGAAAGDGDAAAGSDCAG
jgi:poly(A) polymerase